MKLNAVMHAKSQRLSLLFSKLFAFIHCSLHLTTSFFVMPGEVDQISNVIGDIPAADTRRASGTGSETTSSTSSSTVTHQAMARKGILPLYQYWKVPTVTDEDITAYHEGGWLFEALVCTPTTLDLPMID
jgi:hypothetical protein